MPNNNNDDYISKIIRSFSKERLAGYQQRSDTQEGVDLLSRYLWNLALSESLYPLLQTLEVALRNRLNHVISEHYNHWLESDQLLYPKEQDRVLDAIKEIRKEGKVLTPDRIIAELSFGFWTSLFDSRYEHQQRLWPILLKETFPYMPRHLRTRIIISKLLNRIRNLRNRIYHYEPIWYWQDLSQQHHDMVQFLGWIEPHLKIFNATLDRFPTLYTQGDSPYKELLNTPT